MKQSPLAKVINTTRSIIFTIGFSIITAIMGLLSPLLTFVPNKLAYKCAQSWAVINLAWLRLSCGIHGEIRGADNLDLSQPALVLANHQSTWETMFLLAKMPKMSWVIKQELLNIPFFGWGMRQTHPIAIDRSAGSSAMEQILENGKKRMDEGNWVCLFPEGTRVHPSKKVRFKAGGVKLAIHADRPIYPVAHNAGECWPRDGLLKTPGKITVSIGPRVDVTGKTTEQVMQEVESWIIEERTKLPPIN